MPGNSTTSQGALQVLTLADFTSGIVSQSYFSFSSRVPNASNKISASQNTYGCTGLPGGGLIFGPRLVRVNNLGTSTHQGVVVGVCQTGNFTNYLVINFSVSGDTQSLLFTYSTYPNPSSGSVVGSAFNSSIAIANSLNYLAFPFRTIIYDGTSLGEVIVWNIGGGYQPWISTNTQNNFNASSPGMAIPANGRIWFLSAIPSVTTEPPYCDITYTNPSDGNSTNTSFVSGSDTLIDYDSPSTFGAWGAISSSAQLLVKQSGGGVIISGDIFNPTISRAPAVQGTNGIMGNAALTPLGLVYRSDGAGVWAWNGGSAATKISSQLDDGIFNSFLTTIIGADPTYETIQGNAYNVSYTSNFLLCDGGLYMDTNTNAWWRIAPYLSSTVTGSPFFYLAQDPGYSGYLFSAPWYDPSTHLTLHESVWSNQWGNGYTSISPPSPLFQGFWESNPIQLGVDELVEVEEINFVMQGQGTITLCAIGVAGGTLTTRTQTIDNDTFIRVRMIVDFQVDTLIIQIGWVDASGISPAVVAPILESMEIKYRTQYPIPVSS